MIGLFRTLVTESTQDFVNSLNQTKSARSPLHNQSGHSYLEDNYLDLKDASVTDSLISFPGFYQDSSVDWCVFVFEAVDVSRNSEIYKIRDQLPRESSTDEFIARAHQAILLRPIDLEGNRVFVRLIESGQIDRRDLLNVLAGSSEAKALGLRFILLPCPSIWSKNIQQHETDQPRLGVRIPF